MPTLKRLQAKHASAKMMWFQNGKLWNSRVDAQEAMLARGEMGRRGDVRQTGGGFRDRAKKPFGDRKPFGERKPFRDRSDGGKRSAWTPRGEPSSPPPARNADNKLDWKPKGEFVPAPKRADRPERSEWKPKGSFNRERKPFKSEKPEWKPKGSFDREERPRSFKRPAYKPSGDDARSAKPAWKPKGSFDREKKPFRSEKPDWKPKTSRPPSGKLEWKPKGTDSHSPLPAPRSPEKRKWVPKADYKKSQGIEARRDKNWRPGGEHKDPRQKYKDAKKAKWTRFKKAIRTRAESKPKKPRTDD
jgi:23S rRNA pseudouridine2605 synthase